MSEASDTHSTGSGITSAVDSSDNTPPHSTTHASADAHYPPQVLLVSQSTVNELTQQYNVINNIHSQSNSNSLQKPATPKTVTNTDNEQCAKTETLSKFESTKTNYPTIATINTVYAMQSNISPYESSDEFDCDYFDKSNITTDTDTDESMNQEEAKINFDNKQLETDIDNEFKDQISDNNLLFNYKRVALGKTYISGASQYPPRLSKHHTAGVYNPKTDKCTNLIVIDNHVQAHSINNVIYYDVPNVLIDNHAQIYNIIGDTGIEVQKQEDEKDNIGVILSIEQLTFTDHVLHQNYDKNKDIIIESRLRKWHVTVPMAMEDGSIQQIRMFADPGANSACVRTEWAAKHFYSMIIRNSKYATLDTPGGKIHPKYQLQVAFPCKNGITLRAKMFLVDDLPVDILADINLLEAFGYHFKDEVPPIFRHEAKEDLDLELPEYGKEYRVKKSPPPNWFQQYKQHKHEHCMSDPTTVHAIQKPSPYDHLQANDQTIYHHSVGSLIQDNNDSNYNSSEEYDLNSVQYDKQPSLEPTVEPQHTTMVTQNTTYVNNADIRIHLSSNPNEIVDASKINMDELPTVDCTKPTHLKPILNAINNKCPTNTSTKQNQDGNSKPVSSVYLHCMFIMAKRSYLATQEEIDEAKAKFKDDKLVWNNFDYLKEYPKVFGPRLANLYEGVMKLLTQYSTAFATHEYSRKTMNVPATRLGIKPEHRSKTMYAPQYPINRDARLGMIFWTYKNELNGFWKKIPQSLHCMPHLMVPKKRNGQVYKHRPAFDARVVNQYTKLKPIYMPTQSDYDELHSRKSFTTIADVKNCFDCMPLHVMDQKYAISMPPQGLYQMLHWAYGFMNATPNMQEISNRVALKILDTLIYIDDITIKHPFDANTKQILTHLERFLKTCILFNIQLHPTKFFVAVTKAECFAFIYTLVGSRVGPSYEKKVRTICLAYPTTGSEMRTFLGILAYIARYIFKYAYFTFWLQQLIDNTNVKARLQWTPQAKLAFQQIIHLINNLPLLYYPNRIGRFCVQTDASNYAEGAVLFQSQTNQTRYSWSMLSLESTFIKTTIFTFH